ncbi:MAG: hypothetical protein ACPHTD_03155 [Gammaproteobacteria bacterium]|jgi:hypothetical protein
MLTICALPLRAAGERWTTETDIPTAPRPQATVTNPHGDKLLVFADQDGHVMTQFISASPVSLNKSSCPTFQVDQRQPPHSFPISQRCRVEGHQALVEIAALSGRKLESRVLYEFINGSRIAFRFTTQDGAYHERSFSLSRSKQAIAAALGDNLQILSSPR